MTQTPASRRGFTLLEVLMAAFVVALGSLGLLALFAGAASQQQRSATLTSSVTLSKNAEALIKTKIKDFGTAAALGCLVPTFEPDAWYTLPADARYGYLTINPTNDPNQEALYIEAPPRAGATPITLYDAIPLGTDVLLGVGSLQGAVRQPFLNGAPPLDLQLGDRRLLLKGNQDLEITVHTRQIDFDSDFEILLPEDADDTYFFAGTCDDASNNVVFLGTGSTSPASVFEDHIRINTESFPIDGLNPARIVGFYLQQIETPDQAVVVRWDPMTNTTDGVFPQFRESDTSAEYYRVFWIDDPGAGVGSPIYQVTNPANAEFTAIPDPRTSPNSQTRLTGIADIDTLDAMNNQLVTLQPGRALPLEVSNYSGEFLIERAMPVSGNLYSRTPENVGDPIVGRIRELMYPSRMVDRMEIDYRRRADELISLNDRVSYVKDPNFHAGRRPDMAYSVLYRDRSGRASDQFVVFTYTITPNRADAEWFPPETADDIENGLAPLRRLKAADLVYERDNDRYVLYIDRADAWAASPGQILMFAGASRTNEAAGPGAETPVRVVDVIERNNDRLILVLDQAPRAGGKSLLTLFYENELSGEFDVWGVNNSIVSAADESDWILKPVEARVFQAGEE